MIGFNGLDMFLLSQSGSGFAVCYFDVVWAWPFRRKFMSFRMSNEVFNPVLAVLPDQVCARRTSEGNLFFIFWVVGKSSGKTSRLQEKEAAEMAEQEGENDGQEGELGEEEENFMPDPCIEDELPKNDEQSVISSLRLRPDLLAGAASSLPGSFDQPVKAKQASSKARRKKNDILEDDDQASAEAEEAAQVDPSDVPQWMKDDEVLSQVVKKLGKIYKCFHHLNPSTAFEQRLALGHQLRGVARPAGHHVILTSALPAH